MRLATLKNLLITWIAAALVVIGNRGVAIAGPFGLEQGMTLQQIGGNAQQLAPGKYKTTNVPKPHSAFDAYVLEIGPHSGLCWIKAIGKTVSTSVYGLELHSTFEDLKGRLTETYGSPDLMDRLMPGSIWHDPQDWMMALLKKERVLIAVWSQKSGARLPPDIKSVAISARALSPGSGDVAVEYAFTNETQCDAELTKAEDSAL
jgi:hypothetical protein